MEILCDADKYILNVLKFNYTPIEEAIDEVANNFTKENECDILSKSILFNKYSGGWEHYLDSDSTEEEITIFAAWCYFKLFAKENIGLILKEITQNKEVKKNISYEDISCVSLGYLIDNNII